MSTPANPLGLSDEEFMNLNSPADIQPVAATKEKPVTTEEKVEEPVETPVETDKESTEVVEGETPVVEEKPVVVETTTENKEGKESSSQTNVEGATLNKDESKAVVEPVSTSTSKESTTGKTLEGKPEEKKTDTSATGSKEEKPVTAPIDYEGFYKQIMAPLKANGKVIDLKSPEEAIQLMQMGANYTKKMQAITPYRKLLMMLENNNLLDENRISYLIDLDKKNPDAIKKLVKESGIDPMTIEDHDPKTYLGGNHQVSDEEVNFKTVVEDLKSSPQGFETLQTINTWDQASKEVLWKNPELMQVMHTQRESGIYAQITAEVERRKTLGTIPATTPFLAAYKQVGDEIQAAHGFKPTTSKQSVSPVTPLATKVQPVKPKVVNGEKVVAASTTRSTPRSAKEFVNPLKMSDEEFLKTMADRL